MNNIQQLRYAVEVGKTGSISRAAENLYMGQPHLSKAIRELEEDMNIVIFTRTTKGVKTTPQGQRFLEYARNILSQVDELEALYKPSGVCRFSISLPRASYAAAAYADFAAKLDDGEGLDLRYCETNPMQVIKDVSEGRSSLGILRCQTIYEKYFLAALRERGLSEEKLWDFEYMALMSEKHPLAGADEVTFAGLRHYPEIVHDDDSVPAMPVSEARMLAQTHEKKKKISVYERGIQFELLRALPKSFIWVSPMPAQTLSLYRLVQKRCGDADNQYRDLLIWPGSYAFTTEDTLFTECLKARIKEARSGAGQIRS